MRGSRAWGGGVPGVLKVGIDTVWQLYIVHLLWFARLDKTIFLHIMIVYCMNYVKNASILLHLWSKVVSLNMTGLAI